MPTNGHDWATILVNAVERPGVISDAYRQFWSYSAGNQLLALFQCHARGLTPGPIHTFVGWRDLGRHVRKGEKAITLCMPVTVKAAESPDDEKTHEGDKGGDKGFTRFIYRPHWFVLSQTEGEAYQPPELPGWDEELALSALNVERVAFAHLDGNAQGYACERRVAISPLAFAPHRTLFHELAHVLLGHTEEVGRMTDGESTPVDVREVEAECVALICCESLGLGSAEFSRGYIQHYLRGAKTVPERSAQKVFKAADQILKAGRPAKEEGGGHGE